LRPIRFPILERGYGQRRCPSSFAMVRRLLTENSCGFPDSARPENREYRFETIHPYSSTKEEWRWSRGVSWDFPRASDIRLQDSWIHDSCRAERERTVQAPHEPGISATCSHTRTLGTARRIRRLPRDSPIASSTIRRSWDGLSSGRAPCPRLRLLLAGTSRIDWPRPLHICARRF